MSYFDHLAVNPRIALNTELLELISIRKTSQEMRMLPSVTLKCQTTKIVTNSGSELSAF